MQLNFLLAKISACRGSKCFFIYLDLFTLCIVIYLLIKGVFSCHSIYHECQCLYGIIDNINSRPLQSYILGVLSDEAVVQLHKSLVSQDCSSGEVDKLSSELYDPAFLLPLFSYIMRPGDNTL